MRNPAWRVSCFRDTRSAKPRCARLGFAHQFLAKPCDADTLRTTVSRACELRQLLIEAGLADTVCQLGKLPSLPRLYQAITEEMNREDVSLKRVAGIIGKRRRDDREGAAARELGVLRLGTPSREHRAGRELSGHRRDSLAGRLAGGIRFVRVERSRRSIKHSGNTAR